LKVHHLSGKNYNHKNQTNEHTIKTTTKVIELKESKMKNTNKGFTLIELIMVTIILGILAAVAIPRYLTSVEQAEKAAEDAVISSIRAGLEAHATEMLMANGRRSWPSNPWDALGTKPAGWTNDNENAGDDGEWRYNSTNGLNNITHMRGEGTVVHWDYVPGTNSGGNSDAVGSLGVREAGVGD